MAEELPSLHIDTDWKKQAQEEKRRLAEEQQKRQEQARATIAAAPIVGAPAAAAAAAPSGAAGAPAAAAGRQGRELPQANFGAIVQSLWTQAMLYLGEVAPSGMEPMINLDMARHQLNLLDVLEEKTRGNLTDEEQHALDGALYETRARFINVASQYI